MASPRPVTINGMLPAPAAGREPREVATDKPCPGLSYVRESEDLSALRAAVFRVQAAQRAEAARPTPQKPAKPASGPAAKKS